MSRKLSEMSLEELWQLFPIILTAPDARWKLWYAEEEALLRKYLSAELTVRISHIGSTAVAGLWAKPIIDILVEATPDSNLCAFKPVLAQGGYLCMSESDNRISFNKGYTQNGFAERVFHLHLRKEGDHDELYFRDYLNSYSAVAKEYEKLKLSLWKQYEHDRDGYTKQKTAFVQAYTRQAKLKFKNRYENLSIR